MTAHRLPGKHDRLSNDELHPLVYRSIIGLTIWLVLSAWLLFSRGAYTDLTLTVITAFFLIVVAIPVILWLTWRRNANSDERQDYTVPFKDWLAHPFVTRTGNILGREAVVQILLPISAVAFGMTIFGLVFLFVVPHLGAY
ncbi:MAG: hypothetical protein WBG10_17650 [Pseudolabrys sp.]